MKRQQLETLGKDVGWDVLGDGAATRLVQTGNGVPYQEAKETAIKNLRACLDPLESRLGEINQDADLDRYKRPTLKAWSANQELVVALTKKRAAELVGETPWTFNRCYTFCVGHWWYEFGHQEGVWRKEGKLLDATWKRALSHEEKRAAWAEEQAKEEQRALP